MKVWVNTGFLDFLCKIKLLDCQDNNNECQRALITVLPLLLLTVLIINFNLGHFSSFVEIDI